MILSAEPVLQAHAFDGRGSDCRSASRGPTPPRDLGAVRTDGSVAAPGRRVVLDVAQRRRRRSAADRARARRVEQRQPHQRRGAARHERPHTAQQVESSPATTRAERLTTAIYAARQILPSGNDCRARQLLPYCRSRKRRLRSLTYPANVSSRRRMGLTPRCTEAGPDLTAAHVASVLPIRGCRRQCPARRPRLSGHPPHVRLRATLRCRSSRWITQSRLGGLRRRTRRRTRRAAAATTSASFTTWRAARAAAWPTTPTSTSW